MSLEWLREATELLIQAYKKHPVLYDMRHPRYYNKSVRAKAISEIVEDVQQLRHDTTMKDVVRKIQTLRTQFGQELTKARRHSLNGSVYLPTVWWYQGLSFLQNHIKHRSFDPNPSMGDMDAWKPDPDDSSTFNVSIVRNGKSSPSNDLSNTDFDNSADEIEMEYETEVHYEINPLDMKEIKRVELKAIPQTGAGNKRDGRYLCDREGRKIARTSQTVHSNDQQVQRAGSPEAEQGVSAEQTTPASLVEQKTFSTIAENMLQRGADDRQTSLGNFVSTQMKSIKDDYIYFETQMEILNIMNRGILRQLALDKKNGKTDQESSRERDQNKNHD